MNIIIFGASTTYGKSDTFGGWVQRLRKHVDEHAENIGVNAVFNLGISGNTTEDVLKRFESETSQRVKEKEEPLLMFSIGINDSKFLNDKRTTKTNPEKFKKNIENLIKLARKFSSRIVFIGFQPIDESRTSPISWNKNVSYKNGLMEQFDDIVKDVCKKNKLYFIDVFTKFKRTDYKKFLSDDGLHPNSGGHQIIADIVIKFLEKNGLIS